MTDFALEEWEWLPGVERRYLIEPFQSECLAECGIPLTTICAVECPTNSYPASALPLKMIFFRPEEVTHFLIPRARRLTYLLNLVKPGARYAAYLSEFEPVCFSANVPTSDIESYLKRHVGSARDFSKPFPGVRVFNLPEGVCLIGHEAGAWRSGWQPPTPFRVPGRLANRPNALVLEWIRQQLGDSNSEPAFALRWNGWGNSQQDHYLDQLASNLRERERMMHLIVAQEPAISPEHCWHLFTRKAQSRVSCTSGQREPPSPQLLARLNCWAALLRRALPVPSLNATAPAPLCLLELYHEKLHIWVTGEDISHHERLEALMFLRDWARDKATPEEMAILFPAD